MMKYFLSKAGSELTACQRVVMSLLYEVGEVNED